MSDLKPFEHRAEELLCRVYRGMHHVHGLKKLSQTYWTISTIDGVSTFDFDELTRLVFAAHEYCIRVEIGNGGPRRLKVSLSNRHREGETMWERHPTIEQAIEKWNSHAR